MPKDWSVYLLQCSDNSLYCGITNNMEHRLEQHMKGKASKYTRSRRPVRLAARRDNLSRSQALRLEYQIKQLPAARKIQTLNPKAHTQ